MNLWWSVTLSCMYWSFWASSKRNVEYYNSRMTWTSMASSGKTEDSCNVSVYLGYANNPFGPSTRVQNISMVNNIHQISGNERILKTPLHNQINFEHITDNGVVDSGHQEIITQEQRSKRGVIHLYNMVSCATGCNPLIYKGYGCYCGFLGSGYAMDGIDRCCKMHDWCYDRARCPMFLEYFVPYLWKCYHNKPLCALERRRREWRGNGSCAQRLCECDRLLSECLSRYPCPSSRALCRSSPWRLLQNALMIF